MAELESRLAALTTDTERLKVCRRTFQNVWFTFIIWHLWIYVHQLLRIFPEFPLFVFMDHPTQHLHPPFPSLSSPSFSFVQGEAKSSSESRAELEQQLASVNSTVAILQTEKAKLQTEVQESKKEQDDLLMLLADQDQKIHSLKQKLKELGETVEKSLLYSFSEVSGSFNSGHRFRKAERLYCC